MVLDILVLATLQEGPLHGYELKRRVVRPSLSTVSNNSLYPALRRFEESGAVTVTVEQQEGRPARRTYRLTERGRQQLVERISTLPAEKAANDEEFAVRLALFDQVGPEARAAVLRERLSALELKLATARALAATRGPVAPRAHRGLAVARLVAVLADECRWTAELIRADAAGGGSTPPDPERSSAPAGGVAPG
jgi:DNA-binding PadR family transcriptional regulator